jgi:hypothetical protein
MKYEFITFYQLIMHVIYMFTNDNITSVGIG